MPIGQPSSSEETVRLLRSHRHASSGMLLTTKAVEPLVSNRLFSSQVCFKLQLNIYHTETPEVRQARRQQDAAYHQSSRASGK